MDFGHVDSKSGVSSSPHFNGFININMTFVMVLIGIMRCQVFNKYLEVILFMHLMGLVTRRPEDSLGTALLTIY